MKTDKKQTENLAECGNKSKPLLAVGFSTESGFKLTKKIETLDEFWKIINTDKSIFARHRMYPTAFFQSWNIRLIKMWLDAGWFFQAYR